MTRDDLIQAFGSFPERLAGGANSAAGLGLTQPGEWTPTEVVRHLIAVESQVWQARLGQLAVEDHPEWAWTEPGPAVELAGASLATALQTFEAARGTTVAAVRALDADGWSRTGIHATYGFLDVAGLLRLAVGHDEQHLVGLSSSD